MNLQKPLLVFAAVFLASSACGGRLVSDSFDGGAADGDGGPGAGDRGGDADAPGPPGSTRPPGPPSPGPPTPTIDAGVVCGPHSGGGGGSATSCEVKDSVTCGNTTYTVSCSCPAAKCDCSFSSGGGSGGASTIAFAGCPSCGTNLRDVYKKCGFPY